MVDVVKKIITASIVSLAALLLTACNSQPVYYPVYYTETEDYTMAENTYNELGIYIELTGQEPEGGNRIPHWRKAFATLLLHNYPKGYSDCGDFWGPHSFFLHDMDMDGIPELFVLDNFEDEAKIYAYRNGEIITIDLSDIPLQGFLRGAARTSIGPAPGNTEGFVFSERWPSAGLFGTGADFWRVVIEGDRLVIADFGQWYIDVAALHKLFDNFGWDADEDVLNAAILEHTRLHINDVTVPESELNRVFGRDSVAGFRRYDVTDENVDYIIFGWAESPVTYPKPPVRYYPTIAYANPAVPNVLDFTFYQSINDAMPPFTFRILGEISWRNGVFGERSRDITVKSIYISDINGNKVQHITNLEAFPGWRTEENLFGLHFADYNFDGYMDMVLWLHGTGTRQAGAHHFWLWDNELMQFVTSKELIYFSNDSLIMIHEDLQRLSSYHGGRCCGMTVFAEFIDGVLVEVKSRFWEEVPIQYSPSWPYYIRITTWDYINDTSEVVYKNRAVFWGGVYSTDT